MKSMCRPLRGEQGVKGIDAHRAGVRRLDHHVAVDNLEVVLAGIQLLAHAIIYQIVLCYGKGIDERLATHAIQVAVQPDGEAS
jgi:hypothetical protein